MSGLEFENGSYLQSQGKKGNITSVFTHLDSEGNDKRPI
jgi:hypothetical protein